MTAAAAAAAVMLLNQRPMQDDRYQPGRANQPDGVARFNDHTTALGINNTAGVTAWRISLLVARTDAWVTTVVQNGLCRPTACTQLNEICDTIYVTVLHLL